MRQLSQRTIQQTAIGRNRFGLRARSGALVVEGAIVLGVVLTLLLGMLDLAIAVLRFNTLSEAARRGARAAIVHGELSSPEKTSWGPATFTGTADDSSELAAAIRPVLVAFDAADVAVTADWLDGGNARDDRVRIAVSYSHQLIFSQLFGSDPITLNGVSTMRIQN